MADLPNLTDLIPSLAGGATAEPWACRSAANQSRRSHMGDGKGENQTLTINLVCSVLA